MTKINTIKKIIVEDFNVDARDMVQRLANTLNPTLDQLGTAASGNLSLSDNLKCRVYSLKIEATAASASQHVIWDLNEKPTSVIIGRLAKESGAAPAAAFAISWRYENGKIFFTIIGLDATLKYSLTLIGQV